MARTLLAAALVVLAAKLLPQLVAPPQVVRMVVAAVGRAQAAQGAETTTTEMAQGAQYVLFGPVTHVVFHQQTQAIFN
jgi:hypothetical protein